MPKVTMNYKLSLFSGDGRERILPSFLEKVGLAIMPLVAEAFSNDDIKLDSLQDIDWVPMPYPPGSIVSNPVSIEIMTIGYLGRKKKVTDEVAAELKRKIADQMLELNFPGIDPTKPLIWIDYVDSDGQHI